MRLLSIIAGVSAMTLVGCAERTHRSASLEGTLRPNGAIGDPDPTARLTPLLAMTPFVGHCTVIEGLHASNNNKETLWP